MNLPISESPTERRLQVPGMFALSPSNKSPPSFSLFSSPTVSPKKLSPTNHIGVGNEDGHSRMSSVTSFDSSSTPVQRSHKSVDSPSPSLPQSKEQQQGTATSSKLKQLIHRRVTAVKMDAEATSLRDFTLGVTLGTGTFGRVQLMQQKSGKQNYFALKTMKKCDIVRLKQIDHIMSEALLLKDLSHPFVVNLCATFQDSKRLYLILEYVPGGELFSFLRRERKISDEASRFYASEIVLALDYLHSKDIAYRDLKPENLLLSRSGHLKITDFGFAKKIDGRTWTLCGTPEYLAPEIIQSRGHGKGVDWWALGILIYEMLAGYPPFYEENPLGIYQKILRGVVEWPPFFDSRARELIGKLLKVDVTQRLGCLRNGTEDVANEPWFAKVNWQSVLDRFIPAPFFPPVSHPGDSSNFDDYEEEDETKGDPAIQIKPEDDERFATFGPLKDEKERLEFLRSPKSSTLSMEPHNNPIPVASVNGNQQAEDPPPRTATQVPI